MDVGRILPPVARFLVEDDLERVFERVDRIGSTRFRVEALVPLLQSKGRQRAADALCIATQNKSERDCFKRIGIMADDEWEGLIEAARASPDLRMEVLREFLRTLSTLGEGSNGVRWIKKIADILPDALTREALDIGGFQMGSGPKRSPLCLILRWGCPVVSIA